MGPTAQRVSIALLLFTCLLAAGMAAAQAGGAVHTAALNRDPQVQDAYRRFYNLDYDGALKILNRVLQQHPADPLAVDYVLEVTVFEELYRLDLLDTTLYAHEGFLSGKHVVVENPAVKAKVDQLTSQAVNLADQRIKNNPRDVDAYYARGMAKSLKATYLGLVERSFVSGLHWALAARSDDEKALQLDPAYVDAEMVPAIHQFVVGTLPGPLKMMAGLFGVHGDKAKGLALLRDCANRGVITSVESRTTLMIFLRHEARYQEAIQVARSLESQFAHDYLFALEVANLQKDAGNGPAAVAEYRLVLDQAKKPGYYPNMHTELAWFGLAETLRGQNDTSGAMQAFRQAESQPTTGPDLQRRADEAIRQLQAQGVK
jgi:tetratricopeptide (TPR) repeat protein